jgi:hypothetical protein
MKAYKQLIAVTLVLTGAGIAYFFGAGNLGTQPTSISAQTKPSPTEKEEDKNFPVAVWGADESSKDDARKKKSERFDNSKWVLETVYDTDQSSSRINHWEVDVPPLPSKKSDAILVGTVKSAQAFLSNNKRGIYSEFAVKVANIIKDNKNFPIPSEDYVVINRAGGRVQYPSGKVFKYSIQGQDMPRIDAKYVIFLKYDEKKSMYLILTAYEILGSKMIALDGKGANKESGFDFSKYTGMDEGLFLDEVRESLNPTTEDRKEIKLP